MRIKAETMQPSDVLAALMLLSRIPVFRNPSVNAGRGAGAAWAFPLAGFVLGFGAALAGWLALCLGWPPALAAVVILGAQAMLTGAMHEDGLADCCDGFWGGWTRAARLRIMKDSRIGTYGMLGLGLVTLFRWAALVTILETGAIWAPVIAAAVVSRVPMVALMAGMRNARGGGLSHNVGRAASGAALIAALIGLIALVLAGGPVIAPLALVVAVTVVLAVLAQAKIGGQTGDVLGASQQLAEAVLLASFAAAVTPGL
ncbi:adenosylcobinamide-GDP ribazoletransferase [Halodurantibacterium flavum]|uniref:Adenosylcobinamide-GDP ribazoletransferase n=1 Tax=Halodurantibacterium flavum TaxID=1382802 RepID=A0ABW4S504_9RHOB